MMKKLKILLLLLLVVNARLSAQKLPLDHSVYDSWKSISSQVISEDGKWVSYEINPQQGDGWLYLYNVSSGQTDSVARGDRAQFSVDSKYVVYQVVPAYKETRQAKKEKLKDEKLPKNNLEIKFLSNNEIIKIERVKSFSIADKNSYWMAYLLEKEMQDTTNLDKTEDSKNDKKSEPEGTGLVLYNPVSKKEYKYEDVTDYVVAEEGESICFLQNIPDTAKVENFKINVFDTKKEITRVIFAGKGSVKRLSSDKQGDDISFVYSSDTAKVKVYDLWLSRKFEQASKIVDPSNIGMVSGWAVSENGNISFSDSGSKLFFGTAKKPEKEPEDTLLDDEKYRLDIWSWNDDILQPMQKTRLDQELKRTYLAVYDIENNKMIQLADTIIESVRTSQKGDGPVALGSSDMKYRKSSSWVGGRTSDYYLIDVNTGSKELALEGCPARAYLSPSCKYLVYWDIKDRDWFALPVHGGDRKNLTSTISVPLYNELNDVPSDPSPYGIAGWMDDEKHLLVYDRYDVWSLDLEGIENPRNITNNYGRNNNLRFRYIKLDPEAEYVNRKEVMFLSAFSYDNKEAGFYSLNPGKVSDPSKMIMDQVSFSGNLIKAKRTDKLLWRKGSFTDYPELYISDMNFGSVKRISQTNPEQKKYNWGTSELVEWISFDGQKLQGILYKPEDFDPLKKYPLIVYFYERSSDGLHNYISPAPSASTINRTYAVSNGYLVFVPDIPYVIGYPGQSCYNAVVSGTHSLLDRFDFVDKNKLGLDGQSWGGYQIAYLVTQTDLFDCAFAWAVVSNMTSAYGGIRWASGMSRMFQYERTQSRIGGSLWGKPLHYIENSPLFFVPKINTPLLLMHNDADGAVPWYQGIEFINALRRLEKPAWMLSYNDEAHNLVRRANRKDLSVRKMQFFDYYLKDTQIPYWMEHGISQLEKGKIDGYNLINE